MALLPKLPATASPVFQSNYDRLPRQSYNPIFFNISSINARLKLLVTLAAAARVKTAFRWCKYTCSGSFCQRPATHQTSAALTVAEAWTTFPLPCSILTACSERLLCYATSCKHSLRHCCFAAIPAFYFINAASKRAAPSFYVFSTSTDVISDTFSGRSVQ